MKKITLILATLFIIQNFNAQIFSEDFETTSDWQFIDGDGDSFNWEIIDLSTQFTPLASQGRVAHSFSLDVETFNALTPNNYMISPLIDLSSVSASVSLTYLVGAEAVANEKYSVYVVSDISLTSLNSATPVFTEVLTTSGQVLYPREIDLTSFAGQSNLYLVFRHYDVTNLFNVLIDDVLIEEVTNAAPIATDDNGGTIQENGADGTMNILANDTDPDGNPSGTSGHTVDIDLLTPGNQSTITSPIDQTVWTYNTATGVVTCNPATNFDGTTVMVYTLCDAGGLCDNATITFTVQNTTGIEENVINSKIYPNPVKDILMIDTPSKVSKISISTLDGKEIANFKTNSSINVSNLNSGVYFLVLNYENGSVSKTKFIKE